MTIAKHSLNFTTSINTTTLVGLILLLTSNLSIGQNWDNYAVMLGEKNWNDKVELKKNNCATITIRLDGDGNYYPNTFIDDKSMKKADGKMNTWYKKNPKEYEQILQLHKINIGDASTQLLNKSIEEQFVRLINTASEKRALVFIIHGYRKQMYKKKDNALSMKENDVVERYLGNNKLFIEIYWDSKHITLLKGAPGKKILRMMEASAIPNAKKVGQQLRSLISAVDKTKIGVISHSLGSVVANELSFNYTNDMSFMDGKELNMVYLAPAIGHESFSTASNRGIGNYKLNTCIAYNINDFVLKKEFNVMGKQIQSDATTFGNTSLGCNYNGDIDKLNHLYNTKLTEESLPVFIDMSGRINHNFSYYVRHPSFTSVMEFLFEPSRG